MDRHPWPAKMAKSSIRIYHSRVVLPAQLDLPPCVKDIIDVFTNQVVLRNTSKERKKKEVTSLIMCAYSVYFIRLFINKNIHFYFLDRGSRCMPTPYLFQTKYALFYLFALFKR